MNSLLHVPKPDLSHVLNEIDSVLNENGLFYMVVLIQRAIILMKFPMSHAIFPIILSIN